MSFCRMVFLGYRPRCGYVDPRLSSLERFVVFFSGIGRLSFLGVVGNVHLQPMCRRIIS